jgi:hypothetical protein
MAIDFHNRMTARDQLLDALWFALDNSTPRARLDLVKALASLWMT